MTKSKITKGDVWLIRYDNDDIVGSEQKIGIRPCVIIQNDIGNSASSTTIVALITSQSKNNIPTHMNITLHKPSTIMFEQIRTISKERLLNKIYELNEQEMEEMNEKLKISLGL